MKSPLSMLKYGVSAARLARIMANPPWRFRETRTARVAGFLRAKFLRCYGVGWDDSMVALSSEPKWLKVVWRWCGLRYVDFLTIYTPYYSCFHVKVVVQEGGVWYCDTTYTPPAFLDIRELVARNSLRDLDTAPDRAFLETIQRQVTEQIGVPAHMLGGQS